MCKAKRSRKLDQIANDTFIEVLQRDGVAGALASEEMEKPVFVASPSRPAPYMVLFDPLDGSSNTDVQYAAWIDLFDRRARRYADQSPGDDDLLQEGHRSGGGRVFSVRTEHHAGLYDRQGTSTGLRSIPTSGSISCHIRGIKMPCARKEYTPSMRGIITSGRPAPSRYVDSLKKPDKATGRPYSGRYSGCLVADVHRILLGGGIYLYPGEIDKPEGKLRLLYEANPMAMVVEQAGGRASTGVTRILDIEPKKLHQRVPLIIGSADDVRDAESYIQGKAVTLITGRDSDDRGGSTWVIMYKKF